MTKQAAFVGRAREVSRGRRIEAGTQRPPALLRIPGERQLEEFTPFGAMQIGSGVIPGPDSMRGFNLKGIDRRAGTVDFVSPLHETVSPAQNLVVPS